MTKFSNALLLLMLSLFVGGGCASLPDNTGPADTGTTGSKQKAAAAPVQGGNHYYKFILAQIERRQGNLEEAITLLKQAIADQPDDIFLEKELLYLYLQQDNADQALSLVDKILSRDPEQVEVLIAAAGIKQQTGHLNEAAGLLEKVLELDPDQDKIYILLGELYLQQNKLEQAAATYQKMTRQLPEMWDGYFLLGKVYQRQNRFEQAEENFKKSLDLEPGLLSPRYALIELYEEYADGATAVKVKSGDTLYSLCREFYGACNNDIIQAIDAANPTVKDINRISTGQELLLPHSHKDPGTDYDRAIIELYQSILADYPDEHRASLELALYYHTTDQPEKAAFLLAALGEKSQDDSRIIQYVNQMYLRPQKHDQARLIIDSMRRGAPESSALHYLSGTLFDLKDKKEQALEQFSQVAKDSDFYRHALLQAALLHEDLDQPERAAELFEELLENDPDNAGLYLYAGAFYERREEIDRAIELYQRGLELDASNSDLHFRLGVAYDQTEEPKEKVVHHMKKSLEIEPDDPNALNYLGYTYAEMGTNLDEALDLITKALRLDPDNGYITDSLGWVYFQKGEFEKAVQYLEKAVRLSPDDPILLEHLGDAYAKQNELVKALKCYHRSLEHLENGDDPDEIQNKIDDLTKAVESL